MQQSERYLSQADEVMRLAAKAESEAERQIYQTIAEGWRKLAAEAQRDERQAAKPMSERRTFKPD